MVIIQHAGDVGGVIADAENCLSDELTRILVLCVAVLHARFRAVLIIVTQLDVDHPGDGVCAIRGGGPVFQNLDAIDRSRRDGIQIDEHDINQAGIVSRGIGSDAPPINEDESGARIEATEQYSRRPPRCCYRSRCWIVE